MARVTATPVAGGPTAPVVTQTVFTADGISVPAGSGVLLENTSGSSATITIQTPETRAGLAVAEATITLATATLRWISHLDVATFVRPSGSSDEGYVWIDSSATTGVTWACLD